jgi:hypothetical protein
VLVFHLIFDTSPSLPPLSLSHLSPPPFPMPRSARVPSPSLSLSLSPPPPPPPSLPLSGVCVWVQLVEDRMSYIEGTDQNL